MAKLKTENGRKAVADKFMELLNERYKSWGESDPDGPEYGPQSALKAKFGISEADVYKIFEEAGENLEPESIIQGMRRTGYRRCLDDISAPIQSALETLSTEELMATAGVEGDPSDIGPSEKASLYQAVLNKQTIADKLSGD